MVDYSSHKGGGPRVGEVLGGVPHLPGLWNMHPSGEAGIYVCMSSASSVRKEEWKEE